jgi:hypothetical protein
MKTTNTTSNQQPIDFPIWRTIKLGTFSSNDELIQALLTTKRGEMRVNGETIDGRNGSVLNEQYREQHYFPLLKRLALSKTETEIDLVRVTKSILGIKGIVPIEKVWEVALRSGLELCPQETGPQLVLQWKGIEDDFVRLAMQTFPGNWCLPEEPPCTFSCGVSFGQVGLGSTYGPGALHGNGDDYSDNNVWIFVKPRKAG